MKPLAGVVAILLVLASGRVQSQELLSLDQAVDVALTNNLALRAALSQEEAGTWGERTAYANFLPRVSVDAGYTRIDPETERRANAAVDFIRSSAGALGIPPSMLGEIRPFAYRNEFSTTLTVVQPLYNGGAELVGVHAASAEADRSRFSYEDTEQSVIAQTRIAYYNVLKADALARLSREMADRTRRYLEMTRRRADMGMRTETDVLRWEVQLASDEGAVISADNTLAASRLALNEVMGVELDRLYSLERPASLDSLLASDEPLVPGPALASLVGSLVPEKVNTEQLGRHPAMKMMDANLRLADAGIGQAWVSFRPRINLAFQYGWEKNNTLAFDGYRPWALALSFSWPIFNGFGDYTNLQRAHAEFDRTKSQVESFRRLLAMQATNAHLAVKAARQRIDIARKAEEEAADVLASVSRRYEHGAASNVDLIDVQTAYSAARTSLISALSDYYVAQVELARATGTISQ